MLLKEIYSLNKIHKQVLEFKKERIDNQYYNPNEKDEMTKEKCFEQLKLSQEINNEIRTIINKLTLEEIKNIREKFTKI